MCSLAFSLTKIMQNEVLSIYFVVPVDSNEIQIYNIQWQRNATFINFFKDIVHPLKNTECNGGASKLKP